MVVPGKDLHMLITPVVRVVVLYHLVVVLVRGLLALVRHLLYHLVVVLVVVVPVVVRPFPY